MSLPPEIREIVYGFYHPFISSKQGLLDIRFSTCLHHSGNPLKLVAEVRATFTHCSLALMRTCETIWREMRRFLRAPRYIIDLTDARLYWSHTHASLYQLQSRFYFTYPSRLPKPECLRIELLANFKDDADTSPQVLDEMNWGDWKTKKDILKHFISNLDELDEADFGIIWRIEVAFRGSISQNLELFLWNQLSRLRRPLKNVMLLRPEKLWKGNGYTFQVGGV